MKQLNFDDLNIFISLVETRSFTEAARQLDIPKSRVSRVISSLEQSCGGQLFYRTTREVSLTDLGRHIYTCTFSGIQSLRDGLRQATRDESSMTGTITITAVEDLGAVVVTPIIAQLAEQHPGLKFKLIFSLDVLDLVKHGIDIAIRAGATKQQSYRTRKVGEISFTLIASPRYLERFPDHARPDALKEMDLIAWHQGAFASQKIKLSRGPNTVEIDRPARFRANSSEAMLALAIAGRGVANLPRFMCEDGLRDQRIIEVCRGWQQDTRPISVVTPARRKVSPVVDKVSAYLADALSKAVR